MPTARELLQQADALMRRNRERAVHAGIPQPASEREEVGAAIPEHSAAIPEHAAEIPEHAAAIPEYAAAIPEHAAEIPELTEVVTIGVPLAPPAALGDVLKPVDAVEEIEIDIAPIADGFDEGNQPLAVHDLDGGDHGGDVPVLGPVTSAPPVLSENAPEPEPAPTAAPIRPREPGRLWSLFSFGRQSGATETAIPPVQSVPPADEGSTEVASTEVASTEVASTEVASTEVASTEVDSTEVDSTEVDRTAVAGTAVASTDGTIAAAPVIEFPVREAPATNVAGETASLSIDGTVPASSLPMDAEGSSPAPLSAVPTEDGVVPPATAKPALADDWARWEALAEEVRMQVLQRIDIFTDTRLGEQLAVQLQPIVDRASAELVTTINEHVGKLIRAYIAEAIEREIETWRRGNS
jgi:selectin P ligand